MNEYTIDALIDAYCEAAVFADGRSDGRVDARAWRVSAAFRADAKASLLRASALAIAAGVDFDALCADDMRTIAACRWYDRQGHGAGARDGRLAHLPAGWPDALAQAAQALGVCDVWTDALGVLRLASEDGPVADGWSS